MAPNPFSNIRSTKNYKIHLYFQILADYCSEYVLRHLYSQSSLIGIISALTTHDLKAMLQLYYFSIGLRLIVVLLVSISCQNHLM